MLLAHPLDNVAGSCIATFKYSYILTTNSLPDSVSATPPHNALHDTIISIFGRWRYKGVALNINYCTNVM